MKTLNTSPLKVGRLTKLERAQFSLSTDLKNILVGLLLGDLCAVKQTKGVNVRLHFEQGLVHKDYLYHLYDLFETYCTTAPKITDRLPHWQTGKIYTRAKFQTCTLPCFNELYDLFYPDGKKVVPKNIGDLLTPLGLAYWIGDDGSYCKRHHKLILATNSYSLEEINLLTNSLVDKFNLVCTINKSNSGYVIVIPPSSMPNLKSLLANVMPSMMRHKIDLTL